MKKVYVQDKLTEFATTVRSLLLDNGGYFYICGNARMARQVREVLCLILEQDTQTGEVIIQNLKYTGRYQVITNLRTGISQGFWLTVDNRRTCGEGLPTHWMLYTGTQYIYPS